MLGKMHLGYSFCETVTFEAIIRDEELYWRLTWWEHKSDIKNRLAA